MTDIYNIKYIDDDNNEYIVCKETKIENEEYVMMINLNDSNDYFFAHINNNNIDIIDNNELIKKIIENINN